MTGRSAASCRLCGVGELSVVLDLGHHPLADRFLAADDLDLPETYYPLRVGVCGRCSYAGLTHVVPADERYRARPYSYTAGNSSVSRSHFDDLAGEIAPRVPPGALVVDVGGNDGTLLAAVGSLVPCALLCVDPSSVADVAVAAGVPVVRDYLSDVVVRDVVDRGGAGAVVMTSTLNHADDPVVLLDRVRRMLAPGGVAVVEVPSLSELVRRRSFDTIYLEHVSYFTRTTLARAATQAGMSVSRFEDVDYLGGSIRAWMSVADRPHPGPPLDPAGAAELAHDLTRISADAAATRDELGELLRLARRRGERVVALCASAKGNTLLHYCRVTPEVVECVVDTSAHKVGKFTPGTHLPIRSDDGTQARARRAIVLAPNLLALLRRRYPTLDLVVPVDLVRRY